jgi:hypothetical protein
MMPMRIALPLAALLAALADLGVLSLAGSSLPDRPAARDAAIHQHQLSATRAQASAILKALPSYRQDRLSTFEGPEIAAVERDLVAVEDDDGDAGLRTQVQKLQTDWDSLVGLDEILQREHLI